MTVESKERLAAVCAAVCSLTVHTDGICILPDMLAVERPIGDR